VTVSGGEALAQPLFLREFLELCRSRSIHTAIETCLCADRSAVAMISELADFIQFDIKAMSPVLHRRLTSVDNGRILQNASFLLKQNLAPLVRFPLVPGCNDDEGELNALGEFLAENGPGSALEILPYHRLGVGMYGALGREYALPDTPVPSKAEIDRAAAILGRYPINIIS
jgi:pyruvate formate lyase activating enzyme